MIIKATSIVGGTELICLERIVLVRRLYDNDKVNVKPFTRITLEVGHSSTFTDVQETPDEIATKIYLREGEMR
jgi:hypothetical protein